MTEYLQYLIPVFAVTFLAAGWAAVQILAKRMKTKNHIDNAGGCCGACENSASCEKNVSKA